MGMFLTVLEAGGLPLGHHQAQFWGDSLLACFSLAPLGVERGQELGGLDTL